MHYLDIIILIIVVASAIEGTVQGFVYEVCSLLGLIAGFFLAVEFFSLLAGHLGFIPIPDWLIKAIAFLLILVAANIIFRLVGKSLRLVLRKIFMGWLDRIAGAVFGLVRGIVIVLLITLILLFTPISSILEKEAPTTRFMTPSIETVQPFLKMLVGKKLDLPDVI
ncbi:hypothetical protein CEE37_04975 [candidate division LCP-89 bacterium B3_LCP]|uniref:Colicin V production protein n=1 Tax=candidate division LCP-89 bacterium B3_LCP TaxID=2012998 RepID=A0A532V1C7_UNCL8|nr:MAG: hypothetical protein CEE37_04975 [candidate division LCP-89 bacterium B3_LCP]